MFSFEKNILMKLCLVLFIGLSLPVQAAKGAKLIADINQSSAQFSSNIDEFFEFNGKLYMQADDGSSGDELWEFDGTNYRLIKDFYPDYDGLPKHFAALDNKLYFSAEDGIHGRELWVYDGVSEPTVIDVRVGADSGVVENLIVLNGKLIFKATDGVHGSELWQYDPKTNVSSMVADINPGSSGSDMRDPVIFQNKLYFRAYESSTGRELWVYDGINAPSLVFEGRSGSFSGYPEYMYEFNNKLYFQAHDESGDEELWSYDGNTAEEVAELNPTGYSGARNFKEFNNKLYFMASDGVHGYELWQFDGVNTPSMVADIDASSGSYPQGLTVFKNKLYYFADDGTHGTELWVYDGSSTPSMVQDLDPGTGSSGYDQIIAYQDAIYFRGDDGVSGSQLWSFDGAQFTLKKRIRVQTADSNFAFPINYNGLFYFVAEDSDASFDSGLWQFNGTSAPTKIETFAKIQHLTVFNGVLYFAADDGINGVELWQFDGTNTQLVHDLNPTGSSDILGMIVYNNMLYLSAADSATNGQELWQYDGTNAPTLVHEFDTRDYYGGYLEDFEIVNNILYFRARNEANGMELWQYDGVGTPSLVADIRAGSSDSYPQYLTGFNNVLYFNANDGGNGNEVWQYDGTNPPSMLVDVKPGYGSSYPDSLSVYNNKLYFSADDGTHGYELWQYDGVNAPSMVADANDSGSLAPSNITDYLGTMYFTGTDSTHGRELWQYNGTGTPTLAVDLNQHSFSSNPHSLFVYLNQLYFAADLRFKDGQDVGEELYALSFNDADVTVSDGSAVTEPNILGEDYNSPVNAMDVFDFTISDGGSVDGEPTEISTITLKVSGTTTDVQREQVVWRLSSASVNNVVGTYESTTNSIVFDNLTVSIADGSSENFVVNAYYSSVAGLDDGLTFILSIDGDQNITTGYYSSLLASTSPITNGTGTVVDVNYAPTAASSSAIAINGEQTSILVSGFDRDGDALNYRVWSQPANGTVTANGRRFTYEPNDDFYGQDQFRFYVNDGKLDSQVASVGLTVETKPKIQSVDAITVAAVDDAGTLVSAPEIVELLASVTAKDIADSNLSLTHDAPNVFPMGLTIITFTATNYFGNSTTADIEVFVRDLDSPSLSLVGNTTLSLALNEEYVELGVNATDNVDGDISRNTTVSGTVDISTAGSYVLTYTITDQAGNVSEVTRTVVVGNEAPVITVEGPQVYEAEGQLTDVIAVYPEVSDDFTLAEDIQLSVSPIGPYPLGDTTLTWMATDELGAQATTTQILRVQDTTPPALLQPDILRVSARGIHTDIANDFQHTAIDLVDGEVAVSLISDTRLRPGKHTLEIMAEDSRGNATTAQFEAYVYPRVSLQLPELAEAGSEVIGHIVLSGESPEYPVSFDLVLPQHVQTEGIVRQIESGREMSFSFVVDEQAPENEVLTIGLTSGNEAILPSLIESSIAVLNRPVAPQVDLQIEQGGVNTHYLTIDGEVITLSAILSDLNVSNTHTVRFSSDDLSIDTISESMTLDPATLEPGVYNISVTVTENNTTEQFATTSEFIIVVLETASDLSNTVDSDSDGIVDSDEGIGDTDNDGIPDFLDNDESPQNLPTSFNNLYLQTELGRSLRIGRFKQMFSDGLASDAAFTFEQFVEAFGGDFELHPSITPISDVFNFIIDGLTEVGDVSAIIIPLPGDQTLPADSTYYKFDPDIGWYELIDDGVNSLSSAPKTEDGNCPEIASDIYQQGLNAGDACIKLVLEDGGLYDFDKLIDGQIEDPGMFATRSTNVSPTIALNGTSFSASEGEQVSIDASGSHDANGDTLSFSWVQVSGPSIEAELSDTAIVAFNAPQISSDSQVVLELTVSDGFAYETQQVTINIVNIPEPTTESSNGGGSMNVLFVCWLIMLAAMRQTRFTRALDLYVRASKQK